MTSSKGFTLIEMLIALTLLGLVFVLLFGGLRFGMRAWEHGRAASDAAGDVRSAQDILRGAIAQACPAFGAGTSDAPPPAAFDGTATSLHLLAPAPAAMGGAACTEMRFGRSRDGALSLTIGGKSNTLLDHVARFAVAYLADDGSWQPAVAGRMPRLVRIRVGFPPGDPRAWPDLFVAPRISGGADCTYDSRFKSCRGE